MIEYHYDGGSVAPIHLEDNTWNPEHRLVREVVCSPYRNTERTLFAVFLGDVDASERLWAVVPLPQRVDRVEFLLWSIPSDLVYSWGILALVLCHSSHGKGFAAKRVGQESLQSFHLAPSLFLGRLNNACLKPTHGVADGLPINVMPVSHAVEGCTSSVLVCRHLLFLLCRFVKFSCHERPRGSLPACA